MKHVKSLAFLLVSVLLLGACAGGIKIHIEKKEYESQQLKVLAQIPQFSGMNNTELEKSLNDEYQTSISSWITQMQEQSQNRPDDNQYELDIKQNVRYNENHFVSIVSEIYQYTGGAHGITTWQAKNIDDCVEGKVIALGDLFNEGEDYKTVLNRIMAQMVEDQPELYQGLWEQPFIQDNQGFYIENGKLVIFYPPYELSYYARGFVEFSIPLKDIQTYMKQEYKFLI